MTARPITAVIVDDSAIVRTHLSQLLTAGGIEVLATAGDPLFAWPKLQARWPDVIVLDVEMPRMDGITFLRKLMAERPTPVVMCSTLTAAGASTTMEALAVGAVAFVTKPKLGLRDFLSDSANGLVAAVRAAASARVRAAPAAGGSTLPSTVTAHGADATAAFRPSVVPGGSGVSLAPGGHEGSGGSGESGQGALHETTERVIAIGASTGGVQAIEQVLRGLPSTTPGVVIVQHMPESFTAAFAARLNGLCEMEVREARDGDRVMPGRVLIAPGGQHMQLVRSGAQYQVSVRNGPLVNRHKPSVDVLFKSVAQHAGRNASGVILTGMGDDGARGLLDMRQAGAHTAAQDEASCVVYGMPREAMRINGASLSLPLGQVAAWLLHTVKQAGGVPVS